MHFENESHKLKTDPNGLTRKMFIKIMYDLGYRVTYIQATEAFLQYKGDQLEDAKFGNLYKLSEWVLKNK